MVRKIRIKGEQAGRPGTACFCTWRRMRGCAAAVPLLPQPRERERDGATQAAAVPQAGAPARARAGGRKSSVRLRPRWRDGIKGDRLGWSPTSDGPAAGAPARQASSLTGAHATGVCGPGGGDPLQVMSGRPGMMLHGASGGPGIYLARRSQNSFAYTRRAGAAGAAATPAAGAAAGGPGGPGPLRCLGLFEVRTGALCFGPLGLSAGWAGMQAQQQAQTCLMSICYSSK